MALKYIGFCRKVFFAQKTYPVSFGEEKGSILLLVVFLTSALLLGALFLQSSLQERFIARNYTQKIKAYYIAEAGVEAALSLLNKQPAYFLYNNWTEPVFIGNGPAEAYFTLEWLKPGNPIGHQVYYTLVSRGYYCHTPGERSAKAVIKMFVEIVPTEKEGENGVSEGMSAVIHYFDGY